MLNPEAKPFYAYHYYMQPHHHHPFTAPRLFCSTTNPPCPTLVPNFDFPTLTTNKTQYFYRNKLHYYSSVSRPVLPSKLTPPPSSLTTNDFRRYSCSTSSSGLNAGPRRPYGFGFVRSDCKKTEEVVLGSKGLSSFSSSSFDFDECEAGVQGKTTVMIKNIPNKLNRNMLVEMLDSHCFDQNQNIAQQADHQSVPSEYDFVYLPIDFKSGSNLGYAFVNFTSVVGAIRLYRSLQKQKWEAFDSQKICEIKHARIQGRKALVGHFQDAKFRCNTEEFLPVVFLPPRNGSKGTSSSPNVLGTLKGRRAITITTITYKPCTSAA